jgi:hypothetical protein
MFVCKMAIRSDDLAEEKGRHSPDSRHRFCAQPEQPSSNLNDPPDYGDA